MARHFFGQLHSLILRLGRWGVFVLAVLLVVMFGWLDYASGFEISFSFFYLIPIALVTWYVGFREGVFITFAGVFTWLLSNKLAGEVYSNEWIRFFNAGIRLMTFSMIAYLLDVLKTAIHFEQTLARTDFLTGVCNRREFIEHLEFEIKHADRLMYPISFAYIDLDNFKAVNDKQGHSAGDEHLKLIAQTISGVIRKTDLFARLGGDEFGLYLPNVDQMNAMRAVEKIDQAVMRELNRLNSPVKLSIGIITFKTSPRNVNEMLNKADALMYEAKQKGGKAVYLEIE